MTERRELNFVAMEKRASESYRAEYHPSKPHKFVVGQRMNVFIDGSAGSDATRMLEARCALCPYFRLQPDIQEVKDG